jgi:uncharacterized Zn-finger protein
MIEIKKTFGLLQLIPQTHIPCVLIILSVLYLLADRAPYGKAYRSLNSLKNHILLHKGKKLSIYLANDSGKRFMYEAMLRRHIVSHPEISSYMCDLCKK